MFAALLAAFLLAASATPAALAPSGTAADRAAAEALATQARAQTDPEAAVAAWTKALPAITTAWPKPSESRALALADYGRSLSAAGRLPEAIAALTQAVEMLEAVDARPRPALADAYSDLGNSETSLGRLDPGEAHLRRALEINLNLGPDRALKAATARFDIGFLRSVRGDYEGAVGLMRQSMEAREALSPPADPDRIINRMALGNTLALAGRYEEAEPYVRGAVEDAGRWLPGNDPTTCLALETLASFLIEQGRGAEALGPASRAVEIRRSGVGSAEFLGYALGTLGRVQESLGDQTAAAASFGEADAIFVRVMGPDARTVAHNQLNLALSESRIGRYAEALAHRRHALSVLEAAHADSFLISSAHAGLADSQMLVRDYGAARRESALALDLITNIRPEGDITRLGYEIGLARAEALDGDPVAGLARVKPAAVLLEANIRHRAEGRRQRRESGRSVTLFGDALDVAFLGGDIESGFRYAQLLMQSDGGQGMVQANAALAQGSGDLGDHLRRRRTLLVQRGQAEADNLTASGRDAGKAAEARARLADLDHQIDVLDAEIAQTFPDYGALGRPEPLSIAQAQSRLAPGEALVLPIVMEDRVITFAITRHSADWSRTNVAASEVEGLVRSIREGVRPAAGRAAADAAGEAPRPGRALFDRQAAYRLYTVLFPAQIEHALAGSTTYVVSASGVLNSIPLSVLVTAPPQGDDADPEAVRTTPWLIRRAALQMTLFVTALRPAGDNGGPGGFVGVGAPSLSGAAPVRGAAGYFRGAEVDQVALKALPSLPGTRRELDALARLFRRDGARVLTGDAATETAVKGLDLTHARFVAFATHGLLGGDLEGLSQPGLVFTPPVRPSEQDDGVLTMSEVLGLRLDADLVILSACDTAADNRLGGSGYRTLALAFMLAGARTVMVSHWPVRDDAAARLSVDTARRTAHGAPPAQALRASVLALMNDRRFPGSADPAVWAPFMVVGR